MTSVDGRVARSERTRAAIVDAHLALINEGDLKPSGEKIADRAGVSLRTLWSNFKNMETLFAASGEQVLLQVSTAFKPIPVDLPLPERIDEFCRQRANMLQLIGPTAKAAHMLEPLSLQLYRNRLVHIERLREEINGLFAAELAQVAHGERDELTHALIAVTMWPAWSMLRDGLGLSVDKARAVMRRTVCALLAT